MRRLNQELRAVKVYLPSQFACTRINFEEGKFFGTACLFGLWILASM